MAEAGFTSLVEFHYLHHAPDGRPYDDIAEMSARIAQAAAKAGLGLTLLPVLYRYGNFGKAPPQPRQRRFLNDVDQYGRLLESAGRALAGTPGAVLGLAPHSLRAVAPEDLALLSRLPVAGPIHIHAAEQEKEVADCLAWSKRRPVDWLLDNAGIDARWCLIHATHMTEEETVRLATSGAVAGLCPLTEANLGDGIFPAERFRANGGRYGVGSDSNVEIDAAGELRLLEYGQRLTRRRRNRLAQAGQSIGRSLYDAALLGGAQAAGRPVGRLAPGCRADIVVLDADHPSIAARDGDAVLDGWIFAAQRDAVRDVWAEGEHVVERGRHRSRAEAIRRYNSMLRRLVG
jgi:formiminoglutamate deiminase